MSVLLFLVIMKFSRFLYKDKSQYTFINKYVYQEFSLGNTKISKIFRFNKLFRTFALCLP